eukprot:TRINITY_DN32198_c0_g1_i1.p1 TRINITY_DN32198_c0_g1~~TRINITY_DN32198_c0_g1_i1.p1  ORF type:complete len:1092 (+),score=422.20 TRINITY_DN32198_c0_g1_i1:77-3277(+)
MSTSHSARHTGRPEFVSFSSGSTVRSKARKDTLEAAAKPLVRSEIGPLGDQEAEWFCRNLGLARQYFQTVSAEEVAQHVLMLFTAKFQARISKSQLDLNVTQETADRAIYICPSLDLVDPEDILRTASTRTEHRIECKYLHAAWEGQVQADAPPAIPATTDASKAATEQKVHQTPNAGFVVEAFRTNGTASREQGTRLRIFMVHRPEYRVDAADPNGFRSIAPTRFLNFITEPFYPEYERLVSRAEVAVGAVVSTYLPSEAGYNQGEDQVRVRIGFRRGTTHSFYLSCSQLYRRLGFRCVVKALWPFRNGVDVLTLWLQPVGETPFSEVRSRIEVMRQDISHSYILPQTVIAPLDMEDHKSLDRNLIMRSGITASEHSYAYCALLFAHNFLTLLPNEQDTTAPYKAALFPELDAVAKTGGNRIRMRLRQNMLTERRLSEAFTKYPELVKALCKLFYDMHSPRTPLMSADSKDMIEREGALAKSILRAVPNEINQRVLLSCLTFNKMILRTNFFKDDKAVLSFRLDPAFLDPRDYPEMPYGIFFVVGSCFRGFHIRFRDVSRGGIRLIRSGNEQVFATNVSTLFDENYALALTQQKKNKDIPEGGSKGTILLNPEHQDKGYVSFDQYIDGLLDLILPVGIKDYLCKEELLFFGPDEGTADMMDRAALRARKRGYKLWKAATTGKSTTMGGIPHDTYGMTTRSVHQYVLGFYRKLGIQESEVTKLQTGGPDGDLGSNEVLISSDRTTTIVDGSGVLHDPNGVDRDELSRLARSRLMVREFDRKRLGKQGFFVDIRDVDRTIPDGTVVQSGLGFRNLMHLDPRASADLFVPCGGRPESVNLSNVNRLFNAKGEPRFKIIVEGANLFFTQDSRMQLEKAGVHMIKDASANKGGVTSSSLEVLSALALSDEEYARLMCAPEAGASPDRMPDFYKAYVAEVQTRVEENARLEFECIWKEAQRTGKPNCVLSDEVSAKINEMNDAIQSSSLWNDEQLKRAILKQYVPRTLLQQIGLDALVSRVPLPYLKSIFGAYIAARYVYLKGPSANEFAFFDYITNLRDGGSGSAAPSKL